MEHTNGYPAPDQEQAEGVNGTYPKCWVIFITGHGVILPLLKAITTQDQAS